MRNFPFGKAALVMLILAVASGTWLGLHPISKKTSTLTMWTFGKTHFDAYKSAARSFEAAHAGVTVDVQLVDIEAINTRLQAAFWADLDVPDIVEVTIDDAGSFFRGPLKDIGFVDLTDRIHKSGLWDRMVRARFGPYTSRGRIFGIPHDIHPVQLAYRRDIFEKAGVDVSKIQTWDDFIRIGRTLTIPGKRYMIQLSDTDSWTFEVLLFQRGGGYFDANGNCIMDNDIAVKTMCWYVPLVTGPNTIGNNLGLVQSGKNRGAQILTKAVEDGYLLCLLCPDWRTKNFEMEIPRVSGKMSLMPLPAVSPGGRRTSTMGGTMLGITKHCRNHDLAWEFAQFLYTDKSQLAERFRGTNIIPALRDAWSLPAFNEPRPYWSNQPIGTRYAELAPQVPRQYSSPYIFIAKKKLGQAVAGCVEHYRKHGDKGFDAFVRSQLETSANSVRDLMRKNPF